AEEKQSTEEEPSADRIYADGFSFELPEYWKGKVVGGKIDGGVALYPDTAMGCVEGYELVKLTLVSADAPENAGDYISHVAGRVRGDGVRVDVASKNWPAFYGGDWYRHPNYAGSSQEQEMVAALIDLSSGGAYSYDDVRSAAQNATNDADAYAQFQGIDVDFLNETLIPTVKLDGADDASGGGAATASLSDEEYESIAQSFAIWMFSSAEDTGDGAMRWIGCDSALEFVKPGSDAEACEFWEDTTFHVYLRVGKEAKITKTAGPRHYEVEVVYESALDATGANRQANIATIEVGLDESGYVEDLEVVRLA
ncbi:MAG: hypothetical protein Q3963_08860, partial [Coriobacteriaceae bacterium]|nr:hypothetical protein [Coriobacteriaceae bacterium]